MAGREDKFYTVGRGRCKVTRAMGRLGDVYENWAETYDLSFGEMARTAWERGILADVQELGIRGGRVLDAGAGTGLGGELLLALGAFEIVSVDRSPDMLARCRTPGLKVVADLAELRIDGEPFDLVVSGFDTLNYLDADRLGRFMKAVSALLAPSGHLLFDYSSPKLFRYDWNGRIAEYPVGRFVYRWEHGLQPDGSFHSRLSCRDGATTAWTEVHVQYSLDTFSVYEACRASGLVVVRVRNLDGPHFSPASPTHVYQVVKPDR